MSLRSQIAAARSRTRNAVHDAFAVAAYVVPEVNERSPDWILTSARVHWAKKAEGDGRIGINGAPSVELDAPRVVIPKSSIPDGKLSGVYVVISPDEIYRADIASADPPRDGFIRMKAVRHPREQLARKYDNIVYPDPEQ